jgi:hypothetical protein
MAVPKQAELGMALSDLTRQMGISEQTFLPSEEAGRMSVVVSDSAAQATAAREHPPEEVRGRSGSR